MKTQLLNNFAVVCAIFCLSVISASALTIDPSYSSWIPGVNLWTGADGIAPEGMIVPLDSSQVETILGLAVGDLTEVYKTDPKTGDDGLLGSSYQTTYPSGSLKGGTISYVTGNSVDPDSLILLGIKDGKNEPFWYVFDITGLWDGESSLIVQNLYPVRGAISHMSIFTGENPEKVVPDGGGTFALLGLGVAGLGVLRRFASR